MAKYGTPEASWDERYRAAEVPFAYGADDAYRLGMEFLDFEGWTVEDWGCGTTYAKRFLENAQYKGIDFTPSAFVDVVADLTTYRSSSEAIFMRGVLEHNPEWRTILTNALESFGRRMALTTFVPFEDADRIIQPDWPTLALRGADFDALLRGLRVTSVHLQTESEFGEESVFLCERKS